MLSKFCMQKWQLSKRSVLYWKWKRCQHYVPKLPCKGHSKEKTDIFINIHSFKKSHLCGTQKLQRLINLPEVTSKLNTCFWLLDKRQTYKQDQQPPTSLGLARWAGYGKKKEVRKINITRENIIEKILSKEESWKNIEEMVRKVRNTKKKNPVWI